LAGSTRYPPYSKEGREGETVSSEAASSSTFSIHTIALDVIRDVFEQTKDKDFLEGGYLVSLYKLFRRSGSSTRFCHCLTFLLSDTLRCHDMPGGTTASARILLHDPGSKRRRKLDYSVHHRPSYSDAADD
jgi:hypothetical protein